MRHNLNALIFVMKLFFKVNKTNQKKKNDEQGLEGTHRKNHDTLMVSDILAPKL